MQEQIAPVWVSQGPRIPPENLLQCVFSVCYNFLMAHPSAASWSPPWAAGGYLLQCDPPWTMGARFSMLLSRSCRLISAPASGVLLQPSFFTVLGVCWVDSLTVISLLSCKSRFPGWIRCWSSLYTSKTPKTLRGHSSHFKTISKREWWNAL